MRYLICALLVAQATFANPIEVGRVSWGRDFDAALAESADSGKPVFAFHPHTSHFLATWDELIPLDGRIPDGDGDWMADCTATFGASNE